MITVALPGDAARDATRLRIAPVGAKTRGEAWQRAAECYAEIQGLPDGTMVLVRDGAFSDGDESAWIVSLSVDGRYSAALDPHTPTRLSSHSGLPPYSRPAGDVEFVVKPDWER